MKVKRTEEKLKGSERKSDRGDFSAGCKRGDAARGHDARVSFAGVLENSTRSLRGSCSPASEEEECKTISGVIGDTFLCVTPHTETLGGHGVF